MENKVEDDFGKDFDPKAKIEGGYRYWKNTGIPENLTSPCYTGALTYGEETLLYSNADELGITSLPSTFDGVGTLIEVIADGESYETASEVKQQVWRFPYNSDINILIVLEPNGFVEHVFFGKNKPETIH